MRRRRKFTGIRFECQRCGACCRTRGKVAYVELTEVDEHRLASFFDLSPREFRRRYTFEKDSLLYLGEGRGGDCVLLRNGGCAAYRARPLQCRTWPFWSKNLRAFERHVASFCPGAGKGPVREAEEVRRVAEIQRRADGRIR